jgi:hypothetical protein
MTETETPVQEPEPMDLPPAHPTEPSESPGPFEPQPGETGPEEPVPPESMEEEMHAMEGDDPADL